MDYEDQQKALKMAMTKVAKKAKTVVAERIAKGMNRKSSMRCSMAMRVMHEALDLYEDETLTWDEMIEDITSTLKVIGKMKDSKEDYEEDED